MWGEKTYLSIAAVLCTVSVMSLPGYAADKTNHPKLINQSIQLKNLTGTIRIETPEGETRTVSRGEAISEIPFESNVSVLGGKAELIIGEARPLLDSGQIIRVTRDQTIRTIQIAATYDSNVPVRIEIGPAVIMLYALGKVGVGQDNIGNYLLTALMGDVRLITASGEIKLKIGEVRRVNFVIAPEPEQPKVEEASPYAP
ncbi:MAG: hypothetical protein ACYC5N_04055 [Endomicrobiales bacterium]